MRKTNILLLISVMILTCMSACGQQAENQSGNTKITVSTYAKNEFLEAAAKRYTESNPGVEVNVITFAPNMLSEVTDTFFSYDSASGNEAPEKYIKSINGALMSGEGPDIINMDVLPYYRYVESGFLENLEPFMENDTQFDKANIYEGILEGVKYKGGTYMMPVDYTSFVVQVNSNYSGDIIATDGGVMVSDIARRGAETLSRAKPAGIYLYPSILSLFDVMYDGMSERFLDYGTKECDFDSSGFIYLLETCKGYMAGGIVPGLNANAADENTYYFAYDSIWTQNMLMPYFGFNTEYGDFMPVVDEDAQSYFKCPHSFAINKNSNNKLESWGFIEFLISEEIQSAPGVFPINKKALENGYRNQILQILNDAVENGMELNGDAEQITDEYIEKIRTWSEKNSAYHYDDPVIRGIIKTEVSACFEGRQTSEGTAKSIQQKVSTYLGE